MNLSHVLSKSLGSVKSHSPELLTALGISGIVTTAYLTGKAAYNSYNIIYEEEARYGIGETVKERLMQRTKLVWKLYIPAVASGAVATACIIGASKTNAKRTTAAVTAYSLTERAFADYREKVVEQIGKGKEKKVRDLVAQDKVNASSNEVVILGSGDVLVCELQTGRYFRSDMDTLQKAMNEINAKINNDFYVTLDQLYDILDIPHTSASSKLGWDSAKLLELEFTTTMTPKGEPCLAFDYNYTKPLK